jgi:RNA-binding protein YlmH
MTDEELLQKKRFIELARKSTDCAYFIFTDFLGLAEQSVFAEAVASFGGARFTKYGGCDGAERIMVRFGDEDELGYSEQFPISIVKITPRAPKFAEKLTHRDFLGALLNLGIERHTLGDIVIRDNKAFLFANNDIAPYVVGELTRVRRTEVICQTVSASDLPEGELYETRTVNIQLSGERLDAIIAKVFSLSRDEAQGYVHRRLTFVGGRLTESVSYVPKPGDVISVRGLGRFIYRGAYGLSRKGKLNASADLFC